MPRKLKPGRLAIASHNAGKVRELIDLVAPFGLDVVSAAQLGLSEPDETGSTFIENADLKARATSVSAQIPALADDSGLVVPALGGAPGIHSARWAGPDRNFDAAMAQLEEALAHQPDRRAHFVCALVLCWPDGHREAFEGTVHGHLVWPPRGTQGFGYDPMFIADGCDITFGEMDPEAKHRISHRAAAFRKLVAACLAG
jgi:XTP/dITP diphosphohydrolase